MRYVFCLIATALVVNQAGAQYCPGGNCNLGVNLSWPQAGWPGQSFGGPPVVYGVPGGYGAPSYQYGAPAWGGQPFGLGGGGSCFGSSYSVPSYGYGGFTYGGPQFRERVVFGQGYAAPDWRTR